MIRLEDNVPQNYIDESRDFQLFCRLYNCINNGVRFDIESMIYLLDPFKVNNTMLQLLSNRVGFFPKRYIPDKILRYIISVFPYLIKYKGSKKAIMMAIATVLRAENITANYDVTINNTNTKDGNDRYPFYIINITITENYNRIALEELLNYICPVGYIIKITRGEIVSHTIELDQINTVTFYTDSTLKASSLSNNNQNIQNTAAQSKDLYTISMTDKNIIKENNEEFTQDDLLGLLDRAEVVGVNDIPTTSEDEPTQSSVTIKSQGEKIKQTVKEEDQTVEGEEVNG